MSASSEAATRTLLARAHSPSSVDRIYTEKIQHRPLRLRANSPPPAANAREARRRARQQKAKERRGHLKPKPLSARERRRLGLYDLSRDPAACKHALFVPLHELWCAYVREMLGNDFANGGMSAATKLTSADFHGAGVEVVRSACPGRVGIKGIVVKDAKFVFEIITPKNALKVVPKEGTIFRVEVPAAAPATGEHPQGETVANNEPKKLVFEIHGEQFQLRSTDRASKKFKAHFLPDL